MKKEPLADKYLEELARSENYIFRDYAARSPKASPELLSSLASSEYIHALADNPATPVEVLRKFSESTNMSHRTIIARHPKLPIDIIEAFAQVVDDEKLRTRFLWSLARNPSTPAEILSVIMEESSEFTQVDVARNPNAPASILSPELQRVKAASSPTTSPEALRELARYNEPYEYQHLDVETRVSVARNPNVPVDVLVALLSDPEVPVQEAAAVHADLPSNPLLAWRHSAGSYPKDPPLRIAENPSTPAHILAGLAGSSEENVMAAVARHLNTPTHTLVELAQCYDKDIRSHAVLNPNCPEQLFLDALEKATPKHSETTAPDDPLGFLAPLNFDDEPPVFSVFERHWWNAFGVKDAASKSSERSSRLAEARLDELVASKHVVFRAYAATSPSVTEAQLVTLANDEEHFVRAYVACNPSVPKALLSKLAYDSDIYVRQSVALHADTPNDIFVHLYNEGHPSIQKCLAENPSVPEDLLSKELMRGRRAKEPETPVGELEALSQCRARYSEDPLASWVRKCVASNPSTPLELLVSLIDDEDYFVHMAALCNPNLTQALFDERIQAKSRPIDGHFPRVQRRDATEHDLKELSDSSTIGVRFRAARHPNTPVESIVILAVGDHWEHVRCAAVLHPKCPEQILESALNGEWIRDEEALRAVLKPKRSFWSKLFGRK